METFRKFPLDRIVVEEIYKIGWRFYVYPSYLYGCYIGGRALQNIKTALVKDSEPPLNLVSLFHELLHIQHDVEGITNEKLKELALLAVKSFPSPEYSDYDHDCIETEAHRLTKTKTDLLVLLNELHSLDKEKMNNPIKRVHPRELLIDERQYGTQEIITIYFGALKPPFFRYDYRLIGKF